MIRAFPDDSAMRKIAAENRHSETAFVVARQDGDFDLRWFTPQVETDLCGHATLAAAHVLALRKHDKWPVNFHTRSGILTVARGEDWFELDFPVRLAEPCQPPSELLPALGLKTASVMRSVRDYLVIVGKSEDVRLLSPNRQDLAKIDMGIGGTVVSALGDGNADYVCRYFAPCAGIDEDPATGSIQCTLVPYWAERLGKQTLHGRQLSARGAVFECTLADNRVKIKSQARLYLQGMIVGVET
jgi:PhzF family phenazine biosynthesis protein